MEAENAKAGRNAILAQARERIASLREIGPNRPVTSRWLVETLSDEIEALRTDGFTFLEIATHLSQTGVKLSADTIRVYMGRKAKRAEKGTNRSRTRSGQLPERQRTASDGQRTRGTDGKDRSKRGPDDRRDGLQTASVPTSVRSQERTAAKPDGGRPSQHDRQEIVTAIEEIRAAKREPPAEMRRGTFEIPKGVAAI